MYDLVLPQGFTCAYVIILCPNKELLVVIVCDIETTLQVLELITFVVLFL